MPATAEAPNPVAKYGSVKLSLAWKAVKHDAELKLKKYDAASKAKGTSDDYPGQLRKVMKGFRKGLRPTLQKYEAAKTKKEQHDFGKAAVLIMFEYKAKLNKIPADKRSGNEKNKNPQTMHVEMIGELEKLIKIITPSLSKPKSTPENFQNSPHTYHKVWVKLLQSALTACREEAKSAPDRAKLASRVLKSFGGTLAKLLKSVEQEKDAAKRANIVKKTIPLIKKHRGHISALKGHELFNGSDLPKNALGALDGVLRHMDQAMLKALKSG